MTKKIMWLGGRKATAEELSTMTERKFKQDSGSEYWYIHSLNAPGWVFWGGASMVDYSEQEALKEFNNLSRGGYEEVLSLDSQITETPVTSTSEPECTCTGIQMLNGMFAANCEYHRR